MKEPLEGETPIAMASGPPASYAIALDATHIDWITSDRTVAIPK